MSHNEHDDCACTEYNELVSRREFLGTTGGMSGAALYAWAYPEWLPKVSFADSFVANRDVEIPPLATGFATMALVLVPWALGCFATNSAQQARLGLAAQALAPALMALNTSAIYLGQAIGAASGGVLLSHSGYTQLHWVGAVWMFVAIALSLWAGAHARRPR